MFVSQIRSRRCIYTVVHERETTLIPVSVGTTVDLQVRVLCTSSLVKANKMQLYTAGEMLLKSQCKQN